MTDPGTARGELPLPEQIRTRRDFAAALTLLRDEAGLSVRDVARRSGVQGEHSTIGDWFAGKSLPSRSSVELLKRVLTVCGVDDERVIQEWVSTWRRVRRTPGPQTRGVEPYRGLARYEPQDAEWFFGREDPIAQLMRRVTRRQASGSVHLVVGASGSGKSSLLRAGLIPALRREARPGRSWWPVLLTPEARTLDELADRLTTLGGLGLPGGLPTEAGGRQLVIVVDSLEEVFTSGDVAAQRRFIKALCAAAEGEQRAVVVMSLRADLYAHALGYPELMAAIRSSQMTVGPMSESELHEVVVGPAQKAGIALEDGLVELLLREVLPSAGAGPSEAAHTAGVLPLLSHALHATWLHSGGKRLTVADYRATGGVDGAVAATAEKVYQGLTEEQRALCRRLLVSLVHLAPGVVDTRRRVTQAELLSGCAPQQGAALEDVLDQLIAQRLVTTDFDTVEISHDALLSAWPRLRDWLDTDRSGLLVGRQLSEAATAWLQDNRDPAALYRGGRLGAAQQWAAEHSSDLSDTAKEYLAGSARLARREVLRSRRIALALALLLVLSALTSVFALHSEARAARQRDAALSAKVAGEAGALRQVNPALAAQLGLAAYRLVPTAEARGSLLSTFATPYANQLPAPDSVYAAAYTPNGRLLAAVSRNGTVKLWDTTVTHRPSLLVAFRTRHVGNPASGAVDSAAFSADGRLLATGSWDHTTKLWDLARPLHPRLLATLRGHADNVRTVAFSPARPLLATGSDDRTVRLWDVADPGHVRPLAVLGGHRGSVRAVAFSPDGHVLAAGSEDDTVTTWDVAAPSRPAARARLSGRIGAVFSVAFSPRGHLLAAGTDDDSARLWDDSDPRRPRLRATLTGHDGAVFAVAFAPNGRTLATGSDDNTARLWSVADPSRPHLLYSLAGHYDTVLSAAFSPDGRTLATGSDDFTARLWDISTPPFATTASPVLSATFRRDGRLLATGALNGDVTLWRVRRTGGPTAIAVVHGRIGAVYAVAFSRSGRLLAAGGINNRVRLWRLPDVRRPRPVASVTGLSVSFSPNNRLLVTGGLDRRIRLWNITDPGRPAHLATVIGHANVVSSIAFSPNGRLLVTAGWDRTTRLWDVADARHPLPLASVAGSVAAFSPDGRTLATADGDRLVRLWNVAAPGRPVQLAALTGHTNAVLSVAFSPDGRMLASAGGDRTIRMWNVADPHHPTDSATLTGHTDTVRAVAFSPDGHTLASAGSDSAVRLWETSVGTVAARVCAAVHPSVPPEEWKHYFTGLPYRPPCR